ncbi:MAG: hypothetical protein J6S76_00850 [Clostridia bacterium]|nr:hypothetical protein [Clostridia bacterium]
MTQTPDAKKLSGGFGLMIAAMLFLWNPHVNVIDVLPDFVGWLFAALSMTSLAWVDDDIAQARRSAWILFGITAVKTVPAVFSLLGEKVLPLLAEPTMILTYTLCFGAFELYFGIGVLRTWIGAISRIGLLHDSVVAVHGRAVPPKKRKRGLDFSDALRRGVIGFFLVRYAASFLPELVYLRNTEYLGNVIYGVVIDIRDYRPHLIVLCATIAAIVGLRYCLRVAIYAGRLRKDAPFATGLCSLSMERQKQMQTRSVLERFRLAFGLMFAGGVFLCYLSFENVNILPDFVGLLLLWTALLLIRKKTTILRRDFLLGIAVCLVTVPYYAVRTWHSVEYHGFWTTSIVEYITRNLAVSPEKQAVLMRLQLIMLALAAVETLLVILFFRRFMHCVHNLNTLSSSDGHTLYDSMTPHMMRNEREKYEKLPRRVFVLFCISASFEVIRTLPVFSFVLTVFPIAAVRMVANAVFLWYFYDYLTQVMRMIAYHYTYHTDEVSKDEIRG